MIHFLDEKIKVIKDNNLEGICEIKPNYYLFLNHFIIIEVYAL